MWNKVFIVMILFIASTSCKSYKIVRSNQIFPSENPNFKQCHASSIHQIGHDSLIATWFAGTHESNPDVCIWTSTYIGGKWQTPQKVADGTIKYKTYPTWNPVFYQPPLSDSLFLYYKIGPNPREWKGYYKVSADRGMTWSPAKALAENILGPIKNKPYTLVDGTILSPSSTESFAEIWKAHLEISIDKGLNWTKVPIHYDDTIQVIQPSILQHDHSTVQILCRSKENVVMSAFSKDNGYTWLPWQYTNLKNPNSATDAIRLKSGIFMIVYNPDIAGKEWWEGRTKLFVAVSKDGLQWKDIIQLENGKKGDEYSYPTIIQDDKNLIHITYTYNRQTIKHVVFKL